MNGQAVVVLVSQGRGIVGRVVILISGHYLKSVRLPTGQHQGRKMTHDFGLGRNHHSWNKDKGRYVREVIFRAQRSTQSVSPRKLGARPIPRDKQYHYEPERKKENRD